jgi:glycosidase
VFSSPRGICGELRGNTLQSRPTLGDVPAWAKRAIWYQIFPERFRNGDRSNDPTLMDLRGAWPHDPQTTWQISSWTGDWYKSQPWEEVNGKGFYYNAQLRRYGGDLQGILDKLDYLQQLGVNAIYLNPIFESPSLHKYDATMYHHIDNNFGPDPARDRSIWEKENPADPTSWQWTSADKLFLQLVHEVHKRKMKIIIDGVFNHVGLTFWAFEDVKKNGEKSAYKDWFIIKRYDDPATAENEFDYEGWYGVRELPELREDENGLVSGPREHIRAIVKRWMDPNGDGNPSDGIDGWRLDVAEMVKIPFWREFRKWVRHINPDAYITGEVWWEDWKNERMFNAEPWLRGDAFDAVMNYRFAREVGYFFKAKQRKISASEFVRRLDSLRREYRDDVNYVLMNLMASHDTDRLGSQIVNADAKYDKHVSVNDNKNYDVRKPNADEIRTQKLIALFQMTYVGAPMIYYGDEAGMWGADDPDERKPMLWADIRYANETSHPFGTRRPNDKNHFNNDVFQHYAQLAVIRSRSNALTLGDMQTVFTDDERDSFGFMRSAGNEKMLVLVNNSAAKQTYDLLPVGAMKWRSVFGAVTPKQSGKMLKFTLPPKSGAILEAL